MGQGLSKKQKNLRAEIERLETQKKIGMLRAIAAFLAMFILIGLKMIFQMQGFEWASSTFANMGIFLLAIVAAGVCGMGTRKWNLARKQIARLEKMLK